MTRQNILKEDKQFTEILEKCKSAINAPDIDHDFFEIIFIGSKWSMAKSKRLQKWVNEKNIYYKELYDAQCLSEEDYRFYISALNGMKNGINFYFENCI